MRPPVEVTGRRRGARPDAQRGAFGLTKLYLVMPAWGYHVFAVSPAE